MEILRALVRWGNQHRGDLLVLFFLVLTGFKFLYNGPNVVDLDLYDESTYLYGGVQLLQQGLRDPSYGPLYAFWYFLLSLASPDRVALFYLNFYVLATLTAVSLYLLLRSNQVPLWASWASALLLLLLNVNVLTSPHPSHLALVITLLSLAFASRLRALFPALLVASLGALLSVYVRAEQGPILLGAIALLLGMAVMRWRSLERRSRVALGAMVVLLGLRFFSVTNPFVGDYNASQRTFDAFTHHFAANQLTHNPTGQDLWTNNASVVPAFFPTARSLPQAVAENPSAVVQHVRWNVSVLATNLPAAMFSFYGVTYPVSRPFLLLLLVPLALLTYLQRVVVRRNLA